MYFVATVVEIQNATKTNSQNNKTPKHISHNDLCYGYKQQSIVNSYSIRSQCIKMRNSVPIKRCKWVTRVGELLMWQQCLAMIFSLFYHLYGISLINCPITGVTFSLAVRYNASEKMNTKRVCTSYLLNYICKHFVTMSTGAKN